MIKSILEVVVVVSFLFVVADVPLDRSTIGERYFRAGGGVPCASASHTT